MVNSSRLLLLFIVLEIIFPSQSVFAEDNRCGPRCLLVAARASGSNVSLSEVDRLFPDLERQTSISELEEAAHELGLATLAVCWAGGLPKFVESAAILPIGDTDGRRHFVVALRSNRDHVLLLDFPGQPGWLRTSELISRLKWDGSALHVAATPSDLSGLQPAAFAVRIRSIVPILAVTLTLCYVAFLRSVNVKQHKRRLSHLRTGLSVVELLVTMSIMGLLIALVSPAIQSSREAARRVQCRNNLKQLMLAGQNHHAAQGHFPAASIPFTSAVGPSNDVNLSVHARLLPFLDQMPLFRKLDQSEDGFGSIGDPPTSSRNPDFMRQRIEVFGCPTDGVPAGATSYRVCIGTGPGWWDSWAGPSQAKVGAFASKPKADRDIVDGLSSTVFFSEKLIGDQDPSVYTSNRDYFLTASGTPMFVPTDSEVACQLAVGATPTFVSYGGSSWLLSGYDHTWYNHALPPNASTPDCAEGRSPYQAMAGAFTARSLHDGGVHVAFGDGAVKFVGNSVNLTVWRAISSRKGRETVALDF